MVIAYIPLLAGSQQHRAGKHFSRAALAQQPARKPGGTFAGRHLLVRTPACLSVSIHSMHPPAPLTRLCATPGKSRQDMEAAIAARPPSLKCSFNLGVADFYPAATGKEGAAAHLLARWGCDAASSAHLCDDDNDLPLAAMVGRAFLPSITEVRADCVYVCVGGGGVLHACGRLERLACTTCT